MLSDLLIGALRPLPLRGKWQLLNTFVPHQGERTADAFGCRFRVDLSEDTQRRLYLGAHDHRLARAFARCLPPGGCFVDANADIGWTIALAAQRLGPTGQILAAEARGMSYLRLEGMVRDNHLNQVVLQHGQLGSRDDQNTRTLDSLAAKHAIPRIHLLHLGPQDLTLLTGAARLLAQRRIDHLVCNMQHSNGMSGGRDRRILTQIGVLGFRPLQRLGAHHFYEAA